MNKVFNFLAAIIIFSTCQQKHDGFTVNVEINGYPEGTALLQKRVERDFVTIDSTEIVNGKFQFEGKIDFPEICYVQINDTLPILRVFLENTQIGIKANVDSLRHPKISGSVLQGKLEAYNESMIPFNKRMRSAYQEYLKANKDGDLDKANEKEAEFDAISEEQKQASLEVVRLNSDNVMGPYLIWGTMIYELNTEELETLEAGFAPEISGSVYVSQIKNHIEVLKKVDIGQPFTDISLEDVNGNITNLSELKGKLVLIDFWASWCGPCRRENPNVVALYNEYKDQNFEIFGVSFDTDDTKWKKAIEDDGLAWYHVSDLKGWGSEAGKLYGVRAIPHTVLISPEGIIIEKNLRGEELRAKVEELING